MRNMKNFFSAALVSALAFLGTGYAAINQTVNYQGFLIDRNNNLPVDSSKDIKFIIYDFSSGGNVLFGENRCNVPVNKGRYDVEIGSMTAGGIPATVFVDNLNVWLEIQVDPDNDCLGTYDILSPRIKMQTSPYAFSSVYASTASAATAHFRADFIDALDSTANGAITISTNLFVLGGISVGSISPGQTLAVAGVVESSTGGFKFPDGSMQVKAAAETKWIMNGEHMYSVNLGNIGISTGTPAARLHISSGTGETGNLLLISTGSSNIFRVTGEGKVYGDYFYGNGSNLTGVYGTDVNKVSKTGDTMTGFLEISQASATVIGSASHANSLVITSDTSKNVYHLAVSTSGKVGIGIKSPRYLLDISSMNASSALVGVSTGVSGNIFQVSGNGDVYAKRLVGDGSGLFNISGYVSRSGDTMNGQFTVLGSSVTIINSDPANAFSLMVTTDANRIVSHLYLSNAGNLGLRTVSPTHMLTVNGGGLFISSLTVNEVLYGSGINADTLNLTQGVTASSGTFWAFGNSYSIETSSGIKVNNYGVVAPYFMGDGSRLLNVSGTDSTRLLKAGDVMTGNLEVRGSSLTVAAYGNNFVYAMTVSSSSTSDLYSMAVTTRGSTGFKVNTPRATVHVYRDLMIGSDVGSVINADLYIKGDNSYLNWGQNTSDWEKKGKMGFLSGSRDMIYTAFPFDLSPGIEALKIYSNGQINFPGIITVSSASVSPILYVSTVTGSVSVGTNTAVNKFTVNGGIVAFSSVTAYGGYYGDLSGNLNLNSTTSNFNSSYLYFNAPFLFAQGSLSVGGDNSMGTAKMEIVEKGSERYTLAIGSNTTYGTYDVVITTAGRIGVGLTNGSSEPTNQLQVRGSIRIGEDNDSSYQYAYLDLRPIAGKSYISFQSYTKPSIAVMGTDDTPEAFIFKTNTNSLVGGSEIYRILKTGEIGIYNTNPLATVHIGSNVLISSASVSPILYISTNTGNVGVGTLSASHKLHVAGNAVITSSMSVSGSGLTGTTPVFQIMGGTMTILANGNIGIGTASPSSRLAVEGVVSFGTGASKSTFTASGYFKPVWLDQAAINAAIPSETGLIVGNSAISDLCVSTSTAAGNWALLGSRGQSGCF